ncbi:hypothetical protein ES703_60252 [subsurface metagenome]
MQMQPFRRGRHGVLEVQGVGLGEGDGVVDISRPVGGIHEGGVPVRIGFGIEKNVEEDSACPAGREIIDKLPVPVVVPAEVVAQLVNTLLVDVNDQDGVNGLLLEV